MRVCLLPVTGYCGGRTLTLQWEPTAPVSAALPVLTLRRGDVSWRRAVCGTTASVRSSQAGDTPGPPQLPQRARELTSPGKAGGALPPPEARHPGAGARPLTAPPCSFSSAQRFLSPRGAVLCRLLPRSCPQLDSTQGAAPGRPPWPDPRLGGHGQPRALPFSSARTVSRRRSKQGVRPRSAWPALSCPRVMAAAVRRAAARMGRDSESRCTTCGLLSSASSTRRSTIPPPRDAAPLARADAYALLRLLSRGPWPASLLAACVVAAGGACRDCAAGGSAMCSADTLSVLRSDSYVDLSQYRDQHFRGTRYDQERLLRKSCTLYVGNLSFYTTEEQIHELFGKSGDIKKVIMGLDKVKKTPCGFCFVEYYARGDAENAMRYINGTRLDDRIIRTDWDAGFKEGRQYGRGRSGGQVRDEYRQDYDAGRGGYGKNVQCQ